MGWIVETNADGGARITDDAGRVRGEYRTAEDLAKALVVAGREYERTDAGRAYCLGQWSRQAEVDCLVAELGRLRRLLRLWAGTFGPPAGSCPLGAVGLLAATRAVLGEDWDGTLSGTRGTGDAAGSRADL